MTVPQGPDGRHRGKQTTWGFLWLNGSVSGLTEQKQKKTSLWYKVLEPGTLHLWPQWKETNWTVTLYSLSSGHPSSCFSFGFNNKKRSLGAQMNCYWLLMKGGQEESAARVAIRLAFFVSPLFIRFALFSWNEKSFYEYKKAQRGCKSALTASRALCCTKAATQKKKCK